MTDTMATDCPTSFRAAPTVRQPWDCVLVLLLAFGSASTGCDRRREAVETYQVEGRVLVDGVPANGALVVLHPVDLPLSQMRLAPAGYTRSDGVFCLTTYEFGDGAPVGEYIVTVEWRDLVIAGEDFREGHNLVPAAYGDRTTSPLRAIVSLGVSELPEFNLPAAPAPQVPMNYLE